VVVLRLLETHERSFYTCARWEERRIAVGKGVLGGMSAPRSRIPVRDSGGRAIVLGRRVGRHEARRGCVRPSGCTDAKAGARVGREKISTERQGTRRRNRRDASAHVAAFHRILPFLRDRRCLDRSVIPHTLD
jgi:hypothetical protein